MSYSTLGWQVSIWLTVIYTVVSNCLNMNFKLQFIFCQVMPLMSVMSLQQNGRYSICVSSISFDVFYRRMSHVVQTDV